MSKEQVNHPNHYGGGDNPYEAIKVIEAWELNFCLGNTIKYISRAGKKGSQTQDLRKAKWYLDREISKGKISLEDRLQDELSNLKKLHTKLKLFLISDKVQELKPKQQDLLIEQESVMSRYIDILEKRIKHL